MVLDGFIDFGLVQLGMGQEPGKQRKSWEMEVHPNRCGIVGFDPSSFCGCSHISCLLGWDKFYGRVLEIMVLGGLEIDQERFGQTIDRSKSVNLWAQVTNGFHGNRATKQQVGQASKSSRPFNEN